MPTTLQDDFAGASPRPDLKFPLRAEIGSVYDANNMWVFSIVAEITKDDEPIAAELVRLANLAHEAEAVLNNARREESRNVNN